MYHEDEVDHDAEHLIGVFRVASAAISAYSSGQRAQVDHILDSDVCGLCLGQALVGILVRLAPDHSAACAAVDATLFKELQETFHGELV